MNQGNDKQVCKSNICDVLHDLVSVPIWRFDGRLNACKCMLTLFPIFMPFLFA